MRTKAGRSIWLGESTVVSWVLSSGGAEPTRRLAGVVAASAEEADSPSAEAEGHLSAVSIPTDRAGGGANQPDPARLGAVLCCRRCESVLWFCQRLGGKESPASSDACTETAGLRLEEVE